VGGTCGTNGREEDRVKVTGRKTRWRALVSSVTNLWVP
jgi:hypothetical protein